MNMDLKGNINKYNTFNVAIKRDFQKDTKLETQLGMHNAVSRPAFKRMAAKQGSQEPKTATDTGISNEVSEIGSRSYVEGQNEKRGHERVRKQKTEIIQYQRIWKEHVEMILDVHYSTHTITVLWEDVTCDDLGRDGRISSISQSLLR
jgi:hypothetical protein